MRTLALACLGLLVVTMGLGVVNLVRWRRHAPDRVPGGKVVAHVVLQVVALSLWIAFLASGDVLVAWTAFVVLTGGQVLGDLLMLASHRTRHPSAGRVGYGTLAADVLGFRRPAAALHAILGAAGYFVMLIACILATAGA